MNNVRLLLKSPRFMIGLVVLLAILAFIFIYPLIDPGDPMEMLSLSFEKPERLPIPAKRWYLAAITLAVMPCWNWCMAHGRPCS